MIMKNTLMWLAYLREWLWWTVCVRKSRNSSHPPHLRDTERVWVWDGRSYGWQVRLFHLLILRIWWWMNESRSQYSWLWAKHHVALWVCDRHLNLFFASLLKCFLQSYDQISSCSCKESLDACFIGDTQTSFLNIYKLFVPAKAKEKWRVKEWKWSLAVYEAGKTFVKARR